MNILLKKTVLAISGVLLISVGFMSGAQAEKIKKIQILASSDIHNHFYPYDYAQDAALDKGSLAQISSAIKALRQENPNTIVIDNGDTIQDNSSALFLKDDVLPMVAGINEIGFDVWTAGNHEFNYGMDLLEKTIASFKGQFLAANVYKGEVKPEHRLPKTQAYTIIEKDDVKVAIIGVVTPHILKWDAANLKGYTVTSPELEVKNAVAEIQKEKKADLIIVSFHASVGGEYGDDSAEDVAKNVAGVNAVVAGHEHSVINKMVNNVVVIEPGKYGEQLARLEFTLHEKQGGGYTILDPKQDIKAENIKMAGQVPDAKILELLKPYHERAIKDANEVIGKLEGSALVPPTEIKGIAQAQIQDTPMLDLILQVQMKNAAQHFKQEPHSHHVSSAALFAVNNIEPGVIKKADVAKIYKYDNTLMTIKINGAQLKKYMEWSAEYFNQFKQGDLTISFNPKIRMYQYDMFAGVDYQIDVSMPVGERIKHLAYSDTKKPVEDKDLIYLTANNYRVNSTLIDHGKGILGAGVEVVYDSTNDPIAAVRDMVRIEIENAPNKTIVASSDHNWSLIGYKWDEVAHKKAAELINSGKLEIPKSEDGRTPNVRSITQQDLEVFK